MAWFVDKVMESTLNIPLSERRLLKTSCTLDWVQIKSVCLPRKFHTCMRSEVIDYKFELLGRVAET